MAEVALPQGTRLVQKGVDSFRLIMPRRSLGKYRWIGLAPLIFGLGICGFSYDWMYGTLPGLVMGSGLVILGLAILTERTYSELAVSREELKSIEHFGLCRWSWKRPSSGLALLSVARGMGPDSEGDLGAISIAMDDKNGLTFATGYAMAVLQPVAEHLAKLRCRRRVASRLPFLPPDSRVAP